MASSRKCKEDLEWLRARWTLGTINRIVIALNEGQPITSVLETVPQDEAMPPLSHRLDLRGIDLSHQNLRGPWTFREEERIRIGVNLRGSDLTGAVLTWTILPRADLRDAILRSADLRDAELIQADLSGADLTGANVRGAWFSNTCLKNAKIAEEQLKSRRKLGQLDFNYHAYEI